MKTAHTVALLAALYLVSNTPAYSQDVFSFLQNVAGKYALSWSDLDARRTQLDTEIDNASAQRKITREQAADFKNELGKLTIDINQNRSSGKRLGVTQSIQYSNQINVIANGLASAVQNKVSNLPDIDALQDDLGKQINTALQAGQVSPTTANDLKDDLKQVATMEAAYKVDSGANLTPRQIELLAERLNTVKAKVDQQVKFGQSAIPALNEHRDSIGDKVAQGLKSGRISADEAAGFRADLAKIASQQQGYLSGPGGILTGSQVLLIAKSLDQIDEQVSARVVTAGGADPRGGWGGNGTGGGAGGWNGNGSGAGSGNWGGPRAGGPGGPGWGGPGSGGPGAGGPGRGGWNGPGRDNDTGASTAELDRLSERISSRINQLVTAGDLPNRAGAQFLHDIDQTNQLESAYKNAADGITPAQVAKLKDDLQQLNLRIDARMAARGQDDSGDIAVAPPVKQPLPASMTPSNLNLPVTSQKSFNDVKGYWGEQYVMELASRDVIGGFPTGNFAPNDDITRAQFAAIVVKALNLPSSTGSKVFTDVPSGHWAANAIASASNAGLIGGFPDGTFKPADKITRAQSLVILAKALGDKARTQGNALSRYSDAAAVPSWAQPSIETAANSRIIVSFPNTDQVRPNDTATRGEVAGLMYQTLSALGANLPEVKVGVLAGGRRNN